MHEDGEPPVAVPVPAQKRLRGPGTRCGLLYCISNLLGIGLEKFEIKVGVHDDEGDWSDAGAERRNGF